MTIANTTPPAWVRANVVIVIDKDDRPKDTSACIVGERERWPEQCMGYPHFRREAEDQRAKRGRRAARIGEENATA